MWVIFAARRDVLGFLRWKDWRCDILKHILHPGYCETSMLTLKMFFCAFLSHFSERKMAESSKKAAARPKPLSILRSMEEKYTAAMKKLQFGEFWNMSWAWWLACLKCTDWKGITTAYISIYALTNIFVFKV